eukprot:maker-scaffold_31-snap-gene-3.76-mRNA-1 protein AED:0.21 eAED:0.21 QI:83/1/1/1/1/1/4/148/343
MYEKIYARIGILGNPSDGFNGKVISSTVSNFHTEIHIHSCQQFILRDQQEKICFPCWKELIKACDQYPQQENAIRLLLATCKIFNDNFQESKKMFEVSFTTTIPKQSGLSGSSAITIGFLKCLIKLNNYDIPSPIALAKLALSVETEALGLAGGMQDALSQSFDDVVYMDFQSNEFVSLPEVKQFLSSKKNPLQFVLVHQDTQHQMFISPKSSGKVHSNIKERYKQGEKLVVEGMKKVATLAERGHLLLKSMVNKSDPNLVEEFLELINQNYIVRYNMYGELAVAERDRKIIELLRENNICGKLPGSGGCVLGVTKKEKWEKQKEYVSTLFQSLGYLVTEVKF